MYCRWFYQWKERKRVHFSFGKFQVSSATVFLSEEEGEELKKENGDDNYDHEVPNQIIKKRVLRRGRKVVLQFPTLYSNRLQRSSMDDYFVPLLDSKAWLCALRL